MAAAATGSLPAGSPIQLRSVLSLTSLGVQPQDCSFKNASMSSSQAITISATAPEKAILVVDNGSGRVGNKLPVPADGSTLSPDGKVLAVRGTCALFVCTSYLGVLGSASVRHTRR